MKKCPYCAEEIQDAAIVCKHCHRDLPTPAPAQIVVSTGKASPSQRGRAVAVGVLSICVGVLLLRAMGGFGAGGEPDAVMTAGVAADSRIVAVTNLSGQDWNDVSFRLSVNETDFSAWKTTRRFVSARETVSIPFSDFTDSSGNRLNPAATKVNVLLIRGKVSGKDGSSAYRLQ